MTIDNAQLAIDEAAMIEMKPIFASGIYGIRNMVNGKWYIGQSVNVDARIKAHLRALRDDYHYNKHLRLAFRKYGEANFEFRVLEKTEEGLLDIQERLWIVHYKSNQREFGYNLESGGHENKHHSEETKRKMTEDRIGLHPSDKTKRKLSEAGMGKHHSGERSPKISEALRNSLSAKKHLQKLRETNKGGHPSEETRQRMVESHKNPSDKIRENMSIGQKKRSRTEAELLQIRLLGCANKGKRYSQKSRRKNRRGK